MAWKETLLYYKQSPYQRIAFFTEADGSYSLTLDDYWQFNSNVEHIYHECLFTMPGLFPKELTNVLVLGGGDGLGARELLKYPSVKNIEVVDLDPEIVKFAKENTFMRNLNLDSFNNQRVKLNVTDAKKWLSQPVTKKYDLIIIDFPDPTSDELWDLYTVKLYKQVAARLNVHGTVAVQSSTYNTRAFELIFDRLDKVFPYIIGYHTGASSVFCGFFLASFMPIKVNRGFPKCKWINPDLVNQLLGLPLSRKNPKTRTRRTPLGKQSKRSRQRPGNLSGLGAFGKGAIAPAPEPAPEAAAVAPVAQPAPVPAAVEAVQAIPQEVIEQVNDPAAEIVAPAEEFTEPALETDAGEAIESARGASRMLGNPLLIVGLGLILAIPLIIRIIKK